MLEAGATVDRYQVEALIAEGGMGVVYRVRHLTLQSRHALKIVHVPRKSLIDRLVREGQLQGAFRHPNVVPVTDIVTVEGQPALVMDFVDGPSLQQLLDQRPLEPVEADLLFRGVVAGMAEAHSRGLVHRDLKPSNVLLSRTSEGGWLPRVTDFGIAKVLREDDAGTRSGVAMGTPGYMAPEQFRSARQVEASADVYSLGCLLYHMLCGRPPFTGNLFEIVNQVTQGSWPPPRSYGAQLDPGVEKVLRRCLAFAPADRYKDAGALLSAWPGIGDSILAGQRRPLPEPPASDGATWAPPLAETAEPAATPALTAPQAPPSRSRWPLVAGLLAVAGLGLFVLPGEPEEAPTAQRLRPIPPAPEAPEQAPAPVEAPPPVEAAAAPSPAAPRKAEAPKAATSEAPAPQGEGRLRISGAPASEVSLFLDGKELGARRFDGPIPAGRHKVRLVYQGRSVDRTVEVSPGGKATVCYDFDRDLDCS